MWIIHEKLHLQIVLSFFRNLMSFCWTWQWYPVYSIIPWSPQMTSKSGCATTTTSHLHHSPPSAGSKLRLQFQLPWLFQRVSRRKRSKWGPDRWPIGRPGGPVVGGVLQWPNPRDHENSRSWKLTVAMDVCNENGHDTKKNAWRIFAIIELWWGKYPDAVMLRFQQLCLKIFHLHSAKQKIQLL